MYFAVTFLLLLVNSVLSVNCDKEHGPALELVHVVFRHGSRTPERNETYPLDPLAEGDFYPYGYGQLTDIGKKRSHQLGKVLRSRYSSFLGEIYDPDVLLVKSTNFDRTKMSALALLAALFPSSDGLNISTYSPADHFLDFGLPSPYVYCPKLYEEVYKPLLSEETITILKKSQPYFDYIFINSGKRLKNTLHALRMYQGLYAEDNMKLALPAWTNFIYPTFLHYLAVHNLNIQNGTPIIRRLNGGRMLKVIIDTMVAKSNDLLEPKNRRMFVYSAHEGNVASVMATLNVFDQKFPDYCSAIIIELYKDSNNQYTIKIVHVRDPYKEPEDLVVPGCTTFCPLNQFQEILKDYLPNNYTAECGASVLLN